MALHNVLGQKGEQKALNLLIRKGYTICHTNWRIGHLELDIIARKKDVLCFIEVKSRKNLRYGEPYIALTRKKQQNILLAAQAYIDKYNIDYAIRFDLISIVAHDNTGHCKIDHFKDVFTPFQF